MQKILQPFYTAYVIVVFTVSVLCAFPFIVLIGSFNSRRARKTIFLIVKCWSKWWLFTICMRPRISGIKPTNGRYIIVANHISYLDPIMIFATVPGHFRPLGKKEFSTIPVLGFIYKQVAILVDRGTAEGRAKSMRLMWHILRNEANILIFPEGTFNETGAPLKSFYDGAFRLAINTQTPLLPVIFPDTVHRWHYSAWWKMQPGKNRVIFLDAIPAAGLTMRDLPQLKEKAFATMEATLKNATH